MTGSQKQYKNRIKRYVFVMAIIFVACEAYPQFYEGCNMPKNHRFATTLVSNENAGFQMGKKWMLSSRNKLSTSLMYTIMNNDRGHNIESWNNIYAFENKVSFLSRTRYNTATSNLTEHLSSTIFPCRTVIVDIVLYNLYDGHSLFGEESYKVSVGNRFFDRFLINAGAVFNENLLYGVFNLRFLFIDGWQWLHFRYQTRTNAFSAGVYLQFDKLQTID